VEFEQLIETAHKYPNVTSYEGDFKLTPEGLYSPQAPTLIGSLSSPQDNIQRTPIAILLVSVLHLGFGSSSYFLVAGMLL
jgi:hypothetical protein